MDGHRDPVSQEIAGFCVFGELMERFSCFIKRDHVK